MFGLGIIEIAIICLVALIVIKPRDLPKVLRKLGGMYRQLSDQLKHARSTLTGLDLPEETDKPHKKGDTT